ncbi:MAG: hypothetical protein QGF78_02550 [Candidatus Bathyarchaeota archaeon]|nr:hypothetical protein [Candidatus Bathyarchaeota archaeon]
MMGIKEGIKIWYPNIFNDRSIFEIDVRKLFHEENRSTWIWWRMLWSKMFFRNPFRPRDLASNIQDIHYMQCFSGAPLWLIDV